MSDHNRPYCQKCEFPIDEGDYIECAVCGVILCDLCSSEAAWVVNVCDACLSAVLEKCKPDVERAAQECAKKRMELAVAA